MSKPTHCCCLYNDADELVSQCMVHAKMAAVVDAGHAWQKAFFGPEPVTPSYQNQCEDDLLLALDTVLDSLNSEETK